MANLTLTQYAEKFFSESDYQKFVKSLDIVVVKEIVMKDVGTHSLYTHTLYFTFPKPKHLSYEQTLLNRYNVATRGVK